MILAGLHTRRWLAAALALAWSAAALFILAIHPTASASPPPGLAVLESNSQHIVLELTVPDYQTAQETVDGRPFTRVTIPDLLPQGAAGKPQLPVRGAMVGIPPGADASIRVLESDSSSAHLAAPVLPAPSLHVQFDRQQRPTNSSESIEPDRGFYGGNASFPAEAATIASAGHWRSQHYARVEFHPLQYNPRTGTLVFNRRLRVEIQLAYPDGQTPTTLGQPVDEGAFEAVLQQSIVNYDSSMEWRSPTPAMMSAQSVTPPPYPGSPWFRIAVDQDGMYRVPCGQIAAAAGATLNIDPTKLQLYKNGTETAIRVAGSGWATCSSADTSDYFEFFGQAIQSEYSNTNMYWLTYNRATGKRMVDLGNVPNGSPTTSFTDTIHAEQNRAYFQNVPMVEGADHWIWNYIADPSWYPAAQLDYIVNVPYPAASTNNAVLTVDLDGNSSNGHHTRISINGHLLDDSTWQGQIEYKRVLPFPSSYLQPGANTVHVDEPNNLDPYDMSMMNYIDLSYQSAYTATNNLLRFRQDTTGSQSYTVSGFADASAEAFDITDPFSVAHFSETTSIQNGNTYALSFGASVTAPSQYLTLAAGARRPPVSIVKDSVLSPSLHDATNGADYIIISNGAFLPNLAPLVSYRQSQGLRVKLVDAQNVYDEFSDGAMDPQAIHDFLAYAYANWARPAPSFVVLVGDATFDPKGYCEQPGACLWGVTQPNSTLLPAYLKDVDPYIGEVPSDNRLVAFDANDPLPSISIGRLPANTTADVDAMVTKIVNYEKTPVPGSWTTSSLFVTSAAYSSFGTLDKAGSFWSYSDAVAGSSLYFPPPNSAKRIYYNPCNPAVYPQCALPNPPYEPYTNTVNAHTAIVNAINTGQLIVNFTGHSWYPFWNGEQGIGSGQLFSMDDLPALTNGAKMPVVLDMTCFTGYFVYTDLAYPSLAEANLRLPGNGAVASWSATGEGLGSGHSFLDVGFFDAVMNKGLRQLGPATAYGKLNLWLNGGGNYDLIDTFMLFGDPATRMSVSAFTSDLSIAKTLVTPGLTTPGSAVTYKLTVKNTGQRTAVGVMITDTLSTLLELPDYTTDMVITPTGNIPFVWNAGNLAPGASGTITITAVLDPDGSHYPPGPLTNTATISALTPDPNPANNTSSVNLNFLLPKSYLPLLFK